MADTVGAVPLGGGSQRLTLDELLGRPAWHADAACVDYPLEWWFPERGQPAQQARDICSRCNVRQECADFAASDFNARMHGIWGGLSSRERRLARRQSRAA